LYICVPAVSYSPASKLRETLDDQRVFGFIQSLRSRTSF